MDCSEVRAFGEEVSDEAVRVLIHPAFPGMIRRGKKDVGPQALGSVPVSGELFAVVVGDGVVRGSATGSADATWRGAWPGPWTGTVSRWL